VPVVLNKHLILFVFIVAAAFPARGHDVITTKLTWSKEVSRVVLKRCAGCHRAEGKAFPLQTYAEARPWAKAMQEEVLRRRMPPWNAVKGFGDFKHDQGLSVEEIHLIADWVEGGAPEGDPNLLPATPKVDPVGTVLTGIKIPLQGTIRFSRMVNLTGIELGKMADGTSFKLVAEKPDGTRVPLIWIEGFSTKSQRSYEFAAPIPLEAGTRVLAHPAQGVSLNLLTSSSLRR